jgi:hypothetical protein
LVFISGGRCILEFNRNSSLPAGLRHSQEIPLPAIRKLPALGGGDVKAVQAKTIRFGITIQAEADKVEHHFGSVRGTWAEGAFTLHFAPHPPTTTAEMIQEHQC